MAKDKSKLIPKHARFVMEYLIDSNATQAAIRAGYSPRSAGSQGFDLLQKPEIQQAIEAGQAELKKKHELTLDRVVLEMRRIALFDPRKLLNDDGSLKLISDLDDDTAAAVAGLDIEELWEGRGDDRKQAGMVKKLKIASKNAALTDLMRYFGGFEKDNMQQNKMIVDMEKVKEIKDVEEKSRLFKSFMNS